MITGEADTSAKQSQFKNDLSFFNTFLLVFAYVALFVGTFIIYNTFSIIVAQRTKDTAMLRAIGAGRRQILASVMLESTVVGLLAGALGLGVGVVVSYGLRALLGAVGLSIPAGPTVVAAHTVVTVLIVGMTITVFSALAPAIRASRVAPIAALRDVAIDRSGSSVVRTVAGVVVALAGAALFVAGVLGHGPQVMSLLGLGALATFIGVFILGPTLARSARLLGSPVAAVSGATGRLATENVRRSPEAHRGHGIGAHDRRRPGGLHHHPGRVDEGVGERGGRPLVPGRLRGRLRNHTAPVACPPPSRRT